MRSALAVILVLLLAGCTAPKQIDAPEPVGRLDGLVLDALLRPIPGATVSVDGLRATVGDDGAYRLETNWTVGEHIVVYAAPGHDPVSRSIAPTTPAQAFTINVTLAPTAIGRLDTQSFHGLIACSLIVQAGHSHGSGDPDDDDRVDCAAGGRGQQTLQLIPDPDVQDLLLELFWEANSALAERLTLVLRDEAGAVVGFDEGVSPLRVYFGRGQIQNLFADGQTALIQVLGGIPDDAVGEVYIGAHIEQPFQLYATTGHGMDVPAEFTIDA